MRRLSRWSALLLVVLIAAGLVSVGVAGPAAAAVSSSVPAVDPPAVPDPKNFGVNAKSYMLNLSGKVLGKAMPTAWKREQLALNNRYNHGFETLAATYGTDPANPNYMGAPNTYQDYVVRKKEMDLKGGTDGKPMKAPSTAAAKFTKTVGGLVTAYTGFEIGAMVGNLVPSSWYGVDDKTALVCSSTGTDAVGSIMRSVTGADCNGWGVDPSYQPNQDAPSTYSWSNVCNNFTPQTCMTVNSFQAYRYTSSVHGSGALYCLSETGPNVNLAYWRPAAGNVAADPGRSSAVGSPGAVDTVSGPIQCPAGSMQFTDTVYTSNGYAFRTSAVFPAYPDQLVPIDGIQLQNTDGGWGAKSTRTTTPGDPSRTLDCTITGTDGLTYKASSPQFKESSGSMPSPVCATLPDGVAPTNTKIDNTPVGGTPTTVANQPSTPEFVDFWNSYPECRTGACKLDLLQKPSLHSCFDNETACVAWFDDASKTTNYQCRYGTHDVPIEECNVYSGVFKKERQQVGAPYSDPVTGVWSGGQSAPSATNAAMGAPVQSPLVARGCDGIAVTGFDPVGWVMRPVQCVFEWAFVPRPLVVAAEVNKSSTAWAATPPGKLGAVVGTWNMGTTISGCGGIPFTMFHKTVNFADACPGSALAPTAAVSSTVTGATFVVGGALAIVAIIASVIGYRGISSGGEKE